jgi:hypothetical protein
MLICANMLYKSFGLSYIKKYYDKRPPNLTLCLRPRRNSLTNAAIFESTPEIAVFISSLSCGTKSKAFEKSITIASILSLLSVESAMSWQTVIT